MWVVLLKVTFSKRDTDCATRSDRSPAFLHASQSPELLEFLKGLLKYVVWALSDVSGASAVSFFLSLSYFLQQSEKNRGRQRKVGFRLLGMITKDSAGFDSLHFY